MTKRIQITSVLLIVLIVLVSWTKIDRIGSAFISISLVSEGLLQKGYGIEMTLTNLQTKQTYKTKSLGLISPHSIIDELPTGEYIVSRIKIPLGDLVYTNQSREMTEYFGVLEFESRKAYYLGDFYGYREIGRHNVFHLRIENEDIPAKLLKKLKKKGYPFQEEDFIRTFPYSKEVLTVY